MSDDAGFRGGVIEGFYGRPWSEAQRLALFARMRAWRLGTYLHAPKDDLKHRLLWREPYDAAERTGLARLVEGAAAEGVTFAYALAPGLDLRFADDADAAALQGKVAQALALGVHTVALLFDDVPRTLSDADAIRFGSLAAAQADAANRIHAQLRAAGGGTLLFCPTDYCATMARPGVAESPYLGELGERLEPDIEVFWTGPDVVSETIDVEGVREVARTLRRKPLLWDNLHANDYDLGRVFLGPYQGRPAALRDEVAGILLNPNGELAADTVPLATLAAYLHDDAFEPRAAFLEAIRDWASALEPVGSEPPTPDELAFLADFLYLPFEHGPSARAFLDDVGTLLATPPAAWGATFDAVAGTVARLADLAGRLSRLRDRELVVSLRPYVQDVLIEAARAARQLAARRDGRAPEPPRDGVDNTYGRGFAGTLRRMLPEPEPRIRGAASRGDVHR